MTDNERDEDRKLFREAMKGVRPLADEPAPEAETNAPRPAPLPFQRMADDRAVVEEMRNGEAGDPADAWLGAERGEALSYLRPGVQRRLLRRLRRGHFSIAAELDLHGMTVAVARETLREFLAECRARDRRCVRIVHGKGRGSSNRGPILKGKVDRWLRQRDDVIAFCSAPAVDGGTGAVYVLLNN